MGRIPRLRGWRGSGATAAGPASGGAPPAGPPPGRSARPRPRLPHHRLRQTHRAGTRLIVASKTRIDWLDALRGSPAMVFHQGDYIQLPPAAIGVLEPPDPAGADAQLFQVIGDDQHGNRCCLRRWPLARHGSPVVELPLGQVQEALPHRPVAGGAA